MPPNHKLTNVLKGRAVNSTASETGKVLITFNDGSVLTDQVRNTCTNSLRLGCGYFRSSRAPDEIRRWNEPDIPASQSGRFGGATGQERRC
jgi:hypothetical protein